MNVANPTNNPLKFISQNLNCKGRRISVLYKLLLMIVDEYFKKCVFLHIMNPCFAIIDRNSLSAMAMRSLLWDIFQYVEVLAYNSMESFVKDSNRHFVHFFVDSDILFSNVDEFELLKSKTTVLCANGTEHFASNGFMTLDVTQSEKDIATNLLNLKSDGHYGGIPDTDSVREILSPREKEVLKLMIKGLINKEIAESLDISITTVIFHRNNICEKLQTRSIGKMTIYAVLSGIIEISEI